MTNSSLSKDCMNRINRLKISVANEPKSKELKILPQEEEVLFEVLKQAK